MLEGGKQETSEKTVEKTPEENQDETPPTEETPKKKKAGRHKNPKDFTVKDVIASLRDYREREGADNTMNLLGNYVADGEKVHPENVAESDYADLIQDCQA